MGQLTETRLAGVRTLIQSAPDHVVRGLEAVLTTGSERSDAMRLVQRLVVGEMADRKACSTVFFPLVPLCTPIRPGFPGVHFRSAALARLWRALAQDAPREVEEATFAANDPDIASLSIPLYDELCVKAAAGLRARANPLYAAAAEVLDLADPGGSTSFVSYLDLAPVARAALKSMPEWLGRLTEERAIAVRLAFRDAIAVAEDAGPRLLEILYAHMERPWGVMRIISAVMQRPSDEYAANSELATFGERLLADIDERIAEVSSFNPDRGAVAGKEAAEALRIATCEAQEFDDTLELSPKGPWGSRLMRQKRALAQAVESRLKAADSEVDAALPLQSSGFRRGPRPQPRLTADPDERSVNRARAFLTLLREARPSAERLGFLASWEKCADTVRVRLDPYVEDLLGKLRNGEPEEDLGRVRRFLGIAADFVGLVAEDKDAEIVRRRVAAAA